MTRLNTIMFNRSNTKVALIRRNITTVNTTPNTLAERFKLAREALGMSQADVARRAGVRQSTIGNIEAGTRSNPRKLLQLARALCVLPEWLQDGSGPMKAQPSSLAAEPDTQYDFMAIQTERLRFALAELLPLLGAAAPSDRLKLLFELHEASSQPPNDNFLGLAQRIIEASASSKALAA